MYISRSVTVNTNCKLGLPVGRVYLVQLLPMTLDLAYPLTTPYCLDLPTGRLARAETNFSPRLRYKKIFQRTSFYIITNTSFIFLKDFA